ncbi:MAG: HEAT repeat domain-containing protein [Planctomycetes bacterium]|nr:HEAT repeat domain-containing protein [Planctomycetota bacterium]
MSAKLKNVSGYGLAFILGIIATSTYLHFASSQEETAPVVTKTQPAAEAGKPAPAEKQPPATTKANQEPSLQPAGNSLFLSFFPDDPEAGKRLDEFWVHKNTSKLTDTEFFELFRKGLRRCTVEHKGNFLMQHIGGKYIWNLQPDNETALDIVYHASFDEEYKYYAVYSSLSTANPKSPKVLQRLAEIAMEYNQMGRIIWGVKSSRQETDFEDCLNPYLEGENPEMRERAGIVLKGLHGEIDPGKWEQEWKKQQRYERTRNEFGDKLPELKEKLANGTSSERLVALRYMRQNSLSISFDPEFIHVFTKCSEDENPQIRAATARILGGQFIWGKSPQPPEAIATILRLSKDENLNVRSQCVYYGLSTVQDKSEEVVKRLLEIALSDKENNIYNRACWGLQRNEIAKQLLTQYNLTGEYDNNSVRQVYRHIFQEELPELQEEIIE